MAIDITQETPSYRQTYLALVGLWISLIFVGLGFGMSLPLLPLVMDRWGVGEAMIGLNGMAQSLALLAMSFIVVKLFRRYKLLPMLFCAALVSALCMVLLSQYQSWAVWFLVRLLLGVAYAFTWLGIEVWTNHLAPEHQRGRILGIYAALFVGPTAVGPLLLSYVGTEGPLPFLIIAAFYAMSGIPMWIGYKLQPDFREEGQVNFFQMIRLMPFLILCALMAGLGDGAAWNMMALFGVKSGMTEQNALLLSTVFLLGSLLFQFPLGYLADKFSRRRLLSYVCFTGAISCVLVAVNSTDSMMFWGATLWSGGMLLGIYVISLAILGQQFKGSLMATANTCFVIVFELGTFTGSPVAGVFMEFIHPSALLWMMTIACLIIFITGRLKPARNNQDVPEYSR